MPGEQCIIITEDNVGIGLKALELHAAGRTNINIVENKGYMFDEHRRPDPEIRLGWRYLVFDTADLTAVAGADGAAVFVSEGDEIMTTRRWATSNARSSIGACRPPTARLHAAASMDPRPSKQAPPRRKRLRRRSAACRRNSSTRTRAPSRWPSHSGSRTRAACGLLVGTRRRGAVSPYRGLLRPGWDGSSQIMVGRHQFSKCIDDGATRIFYVQRY